MQAGNAPRRLGVDTAGYFTPHSQTFWNHGCRTVFRYLSLEKKVNDKPDTSHWRVFISKQELDELIEGGWCVSLVQRRIGSNYDLDRSAADQGAEYGAAAAWQVQKLCGVKRVVIWCDCEFSMDVSKEDQVDFIQSWGKEARIGGEIGGLYVSQDLKLDSEELYALAYMRAYWKSASMVPTVDVRGFQVLQSLEYFATGNVLDRWSSNKYLGKKGIRCDLDLLCVDGRGDWLQTICR